MKKFLYFLTGLALFSCISPSAHDPDLVGYWSFDNATVTLAPDLSPHVLDAVNKGAFPVEGKIGQALRFDGKSVLQVSYDPVLDDFSKGITVMAWIKKDTSMHWNTVASREIGNGWSEYFGLAVHQNKALFSVDPDGKSYQNVKADDLLMPGIWYYLAGTYDNDSIKLYLNGKLVKSASCKMPIHFNDRNPLLIGGNSNDRNETLVDCFKGTIDEVQIYKRALTLGEINQQMK